MSRWEIRRVGSRRWEVRPGSSRLSHVVWGAAALMVSAGAGGRVASILFAQARAHAGLLALSVAGVALLAVGLRASH